VIGLTHSLKGKGGAGIRPVTVRANGGDSVNGVNLSVASDLRLPPTTSENEAP
jgi:hypothetical protein